MQKFIFWILIFTFIQGCKKEEKPLLPPNAIQIGGQDWAYYASCGLLRTAGSPSWSDIYVKIDGEDGSSLYLILPDATIGAYSVKENVTSAGGYNVRASAEYYLSPSLNSTYYRTDAQSSFGVIELMGIDTQNKTLNLRIEVVIKDSNQEIEISSGILQNIPYDNISAGMTYFNSYLEKNQDDWQSDEKGADMIGGRIDWFFYSKINNHEQINFNIPWSTNTGTYQLTPTDSNIIFFPEHSPLFSWKLKSGQMQLDEVDFCAGRMRGNFQAVFETVDNAAPPIEFNDVQFEVRYNFY